MKLHHTNHNTMARRIQGEINQQIANECESAHPFEWEARAKRIAEVTPGIEDWDYAWSTPMRDYPMVVLTKYHPPRENMYVRSENEHPREWR